MSYKKSYTSGKNTTKGSAPKSSRGKSNYRYPPKKRDVDETFPEKRAAILNMIKSIAILEQKCSDTKSWIDLDAYEREIESIELSILNRVLSLGYHNGKMSDLCSMIKTREGWIKERDSLKRSGLYTTSDQVSNKVGILTEKINAYYQKIFKGIRDI